MYHEVLMEHYKFPRHKKELENPTIVQHDTNPSCGDQVTFYVVVEHDLIVDIGFTGSGCIISQASADIIASFCYKKSIAVACSLTSQQLLELMDITLGPNRLKCALLALHTLQHALSAL